MTSISTPAGFIPGVAPCVGSDGVNALPVSPTNPMPVSLIAGGAAVSANNGIPIYDACAAPVSTSWNSATTAGVQGVGATVSCPTSGMDGVLVSFVATGTVTAGHITFEVYDGAAWLPIKGFALESYYSYQGYALSTGLNNGLQFDLAGCSQFRIRLDTAITGSGSVKITLNASSAPLVPGCTVGLDPTVTNAVQVVGRTSGVPITPAVTAAAYTAGQVLGGVMRFPNVFGSANGGVLQAIRAVFAGSVQTGGIDLYLFNAAPSGTYTDHASPIWNAADAAKLLDKISLTSAASGLGTMTIYNADGVGASIRGASTDLWVVAVATGGLTALASTTDFTLALTTIQD